MKNSTLVLLACFSALSGEQICGQFDIFTCGAYQFETCVWNPQGSWTQCLTADCDTNNGFSISYDFLNAGWNVQSYPMCYPGSIDRGTPAGMAYQCGTRRPTYSTYIIDTMPTNGAWNCAYDVWTTPTPNYKGATPDLEIMIWLNRSLVNNSGTSYANISVGGHSWHPTGVNRGSWKYVSFVAQPALMRVDSLNIDDFVSWCLTNGYAKAASYVTGVFAGFEITYGTGTARVSAYKVWWPSTSARPKTPHRAAGIEKTGLRSIFIEDKTFLSVSGALSTGSNDISTTFDIRGRAAAKQKTGDGVYLYFPAGLTRAH
jgi:hypothetical protein